MSKELNFIDTPVTDSAEVAAKPEMITLGELNLALVGGGQAGVVF